VKVDQPASWKAPQGYVCTLSNVALEVESSKTDGPDGIGVPHRVYLTTKDWEDKEVKCLIASLRARQTEQIHLEVVLGWDSPFELSVEGGKGVVHITGFVQPGPSWPDDESDGEEDLGALLGDEEEEEEEEEGEEESSEAAEDGEEGSEAEAEEEDENQALKALKAKTESSSSEDEEEDEGEEMEEAELLKLKGLQKRIAAAAAANPDKKEKKKGKKGDSSTSSSSSSSSARSTCRRHTSATAGSTSSSGSSGSGSSSCFWGSEASD